MQSNKLSDASSNASPLPAPPSPHDPRVQSGLSLAMADSQAEATQLPSALRYSVTIVIQDDLSQALGKDFNLYCAWGFCMEKSNEPVYNVVGLASGIQPLRTIAWTDSYHIAANDKGCVPNFQVNEITHPLPIAPGQKFLVESFDKVSINSDETSSSHKDAFFFDARLSCSVVLYRDLDLYLPGNNFTPVFMASDGTKPFIILPKSDYIKSSQTLLIFFAKASPKFIRRSAFDRDSLAVPPVVYRYGVQTTRFTEITLALVNDKPQILPTIKTFPTEAKVITL